MIRVDDGAGQHTWEASFKMAPLASAAPGPAPAAAAAAALLLALLAPAPLLGAPAGSFCAASGWRTVWSDEFDGVEMNASKWEKRTMGDVDRMAAVEDEDIYIEDGALVLRSQRRAVSGYNFTSGAVHTKGKHSWQGRTRVCVRARLPGGGGLGKGQGVQPAHWMMPETDACWPSNGGESSHSAPLFRGAAGLLPPDSSTRTDWKRRGRYACVASCRPPAK